MTVKINMGAFRGAGSLRCFVSNQETSFVPEVMDIYAGWILLDAHSSPGILLRDSFDSFVPIGPEMGTGKVAVQQYPLGATTLVSASISSFGGRPDTCAVNGGFAHVEHFTSVGSDTDGLAGTPLGPDGADLLVLTVDFAISEGWMSEGWFNRVAYQITVLAPTQSGFDYDAHVLQLAESDQPL